MYPKQGLFDFKRAHGLQRICVCVCVGGCVLKPMMSIRYGDERDLAGLILAAMTHTFMEYDSLSPRRVKRF